MDWKDAQFKRRELDLFEEAEKLRKEVFDLNSKLEERRNAMDQLHDKHSSEMSTYIEKNLTLT
jgi:uncharacterized protein YlxW (UPF0749 family)